MTRRLPRETVEYVDVPIAIRESHAVDRLGGWLVYANHQDPDFTLRLKIVAGKCVGAEVTP